MNQQIVNPIIIISAELSDKTFDNNKIRTSNLKSDLEKLDIPFKVMQGQYKGVGETSYMIAGTKENLAHALLLAKQYSQDCILYRDSSKRTYLIYGDQREYIGHMVEIPKYETLYVDGWTYDPETKTYWGVK